MSFPSWRTIRKISHMQIFNYHLSAERPFWRNTIEFIDCYDNVFYLEKHIQIKINTTYCPGRRTTIDIEMLRTTKYKQHFVTINQTHRQCHWLTIFWCDLFERGAQIASIFVTPFPYTRRIIKPNEVFLCASSGDCSVLWLITTKSRRLWHFVHACGILYILVLCKMIFLLFFSKTKIKFERKR